MRNIKLTLEYEGTNYAGWQNQAGIIQPTVQGELEKALSQIFAVERVVTWGASRTDRGVHARGQVATFRTEKPLEIVKIRLGLNSLLPDDITVLDAEEMPDDFHPQYKAKGKIYTYKILNSRIPHAMKRNFTWQVADELDIPLMEEGKKYLLGTNDFTSFRNANYNTKTTVRTLNEIKIDKIQSEDEIIFTFQGDGFLKQMIRNIVGTLAGVGKKKIPPEEVKKILESKSRESALVCAPARGLCLEKVIY